MWAQVPFTDTFSDSCVLPGEMIYTVNLMKIGDEEVSSCPLHNGRAGLITLSLYLVSVSQILKGV